MTLIRNSLFGLLDLERDPRQPLRQFVRGRLTRVTWRSPDSPRPLSAWARFGHAGHFRLKGLPEGKRRPRDSIENRGVSSWSGRPESNRRRPAWEAGILPLNYARVYQGF